MAGEETTPGAEGRTHLKQLVAIGVVASALGIALGLLIDWFPTQASEEAERVDTLWDVLIFASVPVFVLVMVIVLYSVWRYRMKPGEEEKDGPPIHGNTRLEIIWTTIPAIILVALCSYSYVVLTDIEDADASALNVRVVGEQFTWSFHYRNPDGGGEVSSPQLYVPRGQQVYFTVQSKDVIHDFWVPAFRMKIDAVPGIDTHLRVTPKTVGTYPVVCAELCGLGHSVMRQTAHVVEPADVRQVAHRPRRAGRGRRPGAGRRRDRRLGGGARRQERLHGRGLRRLPRAGRRRHHGRHGPRPRRGPEGQGPGLHRAEHRGPERRGHPGLLGRADARHVRRLAPAGGAGRPGQVPCPGDGMMEGPR